MGLKPRDKHATWRRTAVKALTESIAHWERLRDGTHAEGEGPDSESCACCQHWVAGDCGDCPVQLRTGRIGCDGTPFHRAADEFDYHPDISRDDRQREVDFLIETRELVRQRKVNPCS